MKKLIFLLLALLFLLTGCMAGGAPQTPPAVTGSAAPTAEPSAPVFKGGGTHSRMEGYDQVFTYLSAANDTFTLNIQTKLFDEAQAALLWETVADDLETVARILPVAQTAPELYIVQTPLHGVERIGEYVYCAAEDVESGAYREALVCAALDYDIPNDWWKANALTAYTFGKAADEAALRAYYEQSEDMDILSLFPAYFVEEFASEEELNLARETALSLTTYIMEQHGAEAFLEESDKDYRQEWLTSLGVDRIYSDPYAESFEGYSYTSSAEYPFIVTTERQDVFYMLPLPDDVDTPKLVRKFFYFTKKGIAAILAGVEKDAPDYYQLLLDNYAEPISYYFKVSSTNTSHAYYRIRKIELHSVFAALHETVHIIVPESESVEDSWRYEGIANYLPYIYAAAELGQLGGKHGQAGFEMLLGDDRALGAYADFLADYRETYFSYAGKPNTPKDINYALLDKAWFYALLKYPQYDKSAFLTPIGNNDLSYEEAYLFTEYLVDQYSLSAVLQGCLEGDRATFEDVFGVTYKEAKAEWIEALLG